MDAEVGPMAQTRTGHVLWTREILSWPEIHSFSGRVTPRKINMEHNNGGLEGHFPFQMGDL